MKKFLFLVALLFLFLPVKVMAFTIPAFCPSGHELTCNVIPSTHDVVVILPADQTDYNSLMTGDLIIPSECQYPFGGTYYIVGIGDSAFYNCSGLTSVTLPSSITSIGNHAFHNCSGLTSFTFPPSVASIGNNAFEGCTGLTEITLPNSLTSIGDYAFVDLSGITSITLSNALTTIGRAAFGGCSGLTEITLPNTVTSLGAYAFAGCIGLTRFTIPNSVTSMGESVFSYCRGLTEIAIPEGITAVPWGTFSSCTSLTQITLPNSITAIEEESIDGCSSLSTIICKAATPPTIGNFAFSRTPTRTVSVTVPCGSSATFQASDWGNYFNTFNEMPLLTANVSSANTQQGTVAIIRDGCNLTISATPNVGYEFVSWSNGNTTNPCLLILTSDTTIQAIFEPHASIMINYSPLDTLYGSVSETSAPDPWKRTQVGNGTSANNRIPFTNYYRYGMSECLYLASEIGQIGRIDTISYYVENAGGYSCSEITIYIGETQNTNLSNGWIRQDGTNFRLVYTRNNTTIGANAGWESFALDTPYQYDGTSNLYVIVCHQANNWNGNLKYRYTSTSNKCRYRLSDNIMLDGHINGESAGSLISERANIRFSFAKNTHERLYRSTTELTATPNEGYQFFSWSDHCIDNPRTITLTQDTSLVAYFCPGPNVEYVHDTTIVHDTVDRIVHDTTYVTLLLRDSIIIYGTHDTIVYHDTINDCRYQQLMVIANNDTLGVCAGNGSFPQGSTVQILAIPNEGMRFLRWSDGSTENPRTITLNGNISLTAIFERREQ